MTNQESSFEKLDVYQLSFDFVAQVYKLVHKFDQKDAGFICSQLKRAAASMPLNLAEGSSSMTKRDYLNHVNYAYKSSTETKVILKLCKNLGYMTKDDLTRFLEKLDEIRKRIYGLRSTLIKNSNFRAGDRFNFYLKKDS
jgi:four helix bundle protein